MPNYYIILVSLAMKVRDIRFCDLEIEGHEGLYKLLVSGLCAFVAFLF